MSGKYWAKNKVSLKIFFILSGTASCSILKFRKNEFWKINCKLSSPMLDINRHHYF